MRKPSPDPRSAVMTTLCMLVFSMPLLLLFITGEATRGFDGEKDYIRPDFKAAGFLNGSFQADFENWFSTKYPMRPEIVEIYGLLDAGYEPYGYRGTAQVVIGKDGCLFENGYINEYFGYADKYTAVTDSRLELTAAALKAVQKSLAARGAAFCVVFTPSKASQMPEYIPSWYTARFTPYPDYVRPYTRFLRILERENVFFIDSASLCRSLGLTDTFPRTGTHWTKSAAFETARAVIAEYERQTGIQTKHLESARILSGENPPGFGNSEKDIFGIVYAGKKSELANAVTDSAYYWPDAYTANAGKPSIPHITIQGGSFTNDLIYYFREFDIASDITSFRYNNGGDTNIDWESVISKTGFVLLEINEQFVYGMGQNAPLFGQSDFLPVSPGNNIIDSLYGWLSEEG